MSFDGSTNTGSAAVLDRNEVLALARLSDRMQIYGFCDIAAVPGLLLNFQEYDRTDSEKAGGPYTGTGTREPLGMATTERRGPPLAPHRVP